MRLRWRRRRRRASDDAPGRVDPPPPPVALASGVSQKFTATASDADGDTLAYAWELDDVTKPGGTENGGTSADAT